MKTPLVERDFYTDKEIAAKCGVTPQAVRMWRLREVGPPFVRICGVVRYPKAAFDEYIATNTVRHAKRA